MDDDEEQGVQTLREMLKKKVEDMVRVEVAKFEVRAAYNVVTHFAWQHYERSQILERIHEERVEQDSNEKALAKFKEYVCKIEQEGLITKNTKTLLTKIANIDTDNKRLNAVIRELKATNKELEDDLAAETTKRQEAQEDVEFFEQKWIESLILMNSKTNFQVDQEVLGAALLTIAQEKANRQDQNVVHQDESNSEAKTTETSPTKRRRVRPNLDSD